MPHSYSGGNATRVSLNTTQNWLFLEAAFCDCSYVANFLLHGWQSSTSAIMQGEAG
jgi:hypothetical protein